MTSTYPSPASIKTPNVGNGASVQVAPQNLARAALYVFNPGPNVLWLCPSVSIDQTPLLATVAGVGSVSIQPQQGLVFSNFTGAMNAISSTGPTNAITVWEYYQ